MPKVRIELTGVTPHRFLSLVRVAEGGSGGAGFGSVAGSPDTIRNEYVATGANYFVGSFQWGDLSHKQAMRSIELFTNEVTSVYDPDRCPSFDRLTINTNGQAM